MAARKRFARLAVYHHAQRVHQSTEGAARLALDDAVETSTERAQSDPLQLRDLDAALRLLPVEQREVLLLVGLEQLSYAEVSKALSVPVGTVMSRLSRGRERLRALMSGSATVTSLKVVK